MKKFIFFTLTILLCFCFVACNFNIGKPTDSANSDSSLPSFSDSSGSISSLDSESYGNSTNSTNSEISTSLPDSTSAGNQLPEKLLGRVEITKMPDGVNFYNQAEVYVENTKLQLLNVKVNNIHSWLGDTPNRDDMGVGYFSLSGKTKVTVKKQNLKSCTIRPLSAEITANCTGGEATFIIKSAGNYSIEINDDPKEAIFLFVSETDKNVSEQGNVIRFSKGIHNIGERVLYSNTTVILDDGAIVRGRFTAYMQNNITICGNGIIDGSTFTRNAYTGEVTVPLDFNWCQNITFKDFSVLDPAGWCVNWYFCTNSHIDGIKIISSRSNGDGISIQSCKDIDVKNCFLRTWDDSLVVKNYPKWEDRSIEGETQNITFENCTLWTDLAQSMEVGYETVGTILKDVTFKNITVLHNFHKPVMSIHNGNNANVQNVTFDTITVEDASMGLGDAGSNNQLCEFKVGYNSTWSDQHKVTALGQIDGVTVKNVAVLDGNYVIPISVEGCVEQRQGFSSSVHMVTNVTFENIWIKNKVITQSYSYLNKNNYTSNIKVNVGINKVTAPFNFSMTQQELDGYADNSNVLVR